MLQNGHLFSRVRQSTRWDITEGSNCEINCAGCNFKHEHDPYPYQTKWQEKYGLEAYHNLYKRWNSQMRFSDRELQQLVEHYQSLIKEGP